MFKLYIIGIVILIVAIVANSIIGKLGLLSWYDFIARISNKGIVALSTVRLTDYLWLFFGYPLILGLGYVLGEKLYNFLQSLIAL
ncbi:MAG: hypothetical protein CSA39_04830 [Flavobacteriales bacterium]|nr:MAG: hypothetical protein CSA39_04830 [Flavobacteriales bacterium]